MSGSSVFSNSVMNISANTVPSGDPIATPSVIYQVHEKKLEKDIRRKHMKETRIIISNKRSNYI